MSTLTHPAVRSTDRTRLMAELADCPPGWSCWYCDVPLVPMGSAEALLCVVSDLTTGAIVPLDGYAFPEVEHCTPRSRGGSDHITNLALACGPCNRSKGTLTWDEWFRREYGDTAWRECFELTA